MAKGSIAVILGFLESASEWQLSKQIEHTCVDSLD